MSVLSRASAAPTHAQLGALLDSADEALVLVDPRHRVTYANRAATRLLGCEAGQGLDVAFARLAEPQRSELRDAAAGSAAWQRDATLVDGHPVHLALAPGPGGMRLLRARSGASLSQAPRLDARATGEVVRLLWDAPQPLIVQDARHVIVAANRAFLTALGRPLPEVLGHDPVEFVPPEDRPEVRAARLERPSLGRPGQTLPLVERRLSDAQGQLRWFRVLPREVSADDGSPLLLSVLVDITHEREARVRIDRSVHELEHWFDLSPVGMLVYDQTGLVLRSNAAFGALVGRTPVMLHEAAADLRQLLAWEGDRPHAELRVDGPTLEVRATVQAPDGRMPRLRARLRAFHSDDGPMRVMAVVEDRSLEDERDLAQLEIGALMDTAGVGVATFEASRGWLPSRAGPGKGSSGLQPGLQSIRREQVEPSSLPEFERLQQALRHGERVQVRYEVRAPELGRRWLLTRVEPGELTGGRTAVSVVTLDITEQEESHRRSEQLLRELSAILDGTSAGMAYLRGERLVRCNQRFEAMLGLPAGGAAGATLETLFADHAAALAVARRALGIEGRFETELHLGERWYSLSISRAASLGEPEAVAVLTDVSRLKAQQAELETMARERELMFNLSDVGIAHVRDGCIGRANDALARLTGRRADELAGLPLAELFEDPQAHSVQWAEQETELARTGQWLGERRLRRRDGSMLWVQVTKRRVDGGDDQAGLICSYVDIDERRSAREALQLQAERTRAILDSVLVGIVTVGDGGIEWMNRSARRMFGGELTDFVGAPIATVATDEPDHPLRATHYRRSLAEGQAETFECRLRARDGREFWVVGNAVVTGRESTGSQITFALLDIERRRQAEISIAQAQASLQRIIDTAPLAIALFDGPSGRVLRLNAMAGLYFDQPVDDLLERTPEQCFDAGQAAALHADLRAALASGEVLHRERQRPSADGAGSPRVWDTRIVAIGSAGEPQLLLVASDVTEQRAAEQARFDAAVSQREMLVKEVHHRIKNNLQGVAGLLQQTAARRPEVAALISEVVGQVQAIAQVHGLQVGVTGPLRIRPLVEAVAASVQRTFGRAVAVQVGGSPAHRYALPEAESIPIALTINELLTNAMKHSTPGDITCRLHCTDTEVSFRIDSPGTLREGFSLAQVPPGVSGLGLVRALLPRRTATMTLAQDGAVVAAEVRLRPPGFTVLEPL
ncbi:PAS domain S-box protein [Ideonella sp. A 288]|uniref:PAS domain S-box protein n=1 Tax=Ideonella sp. A 288 TaxID=1962181 RepID=UPI000B4B673C|nr:PAS domain S-box protein [Ideonella sp. A 288]